MPLPLLGKAGSNTSSVLQLPFLSRTGSSGISYRLSPTGSWQATPCLRRFSFWRLPYPPQRGHYYVFCNRCNTGNASTCTKPRFFWSHWPGPREGCLNDNKLLFFLTQNPPQIYSQSFPSCFLRIAEVPLVADTFCCFQGASMISSCAAHGPTEWFPVQY